ncbi:MAG TPA: alkaline phosphatase family protein [Rhizomicrobium sp.]|nr:alkaline phosphatase family protein [Rhizomicrobium sp.]
MTGKGRLVLMIAFSMAIAGIATNRAAAQPAGHLNQIHHVFVIVLENKSFRETFGPNSPAPYLSKTLTSRGALLENYFAIGHASLDNYVAMISGQPPNEDTQRDCPLVTEFVPSRPEIDAQGRLLGHGCLYPRNVATLADQLERRGLTWRGYMQDMGKDASREKETCGHALLNTRDKLLTATLSDAYADKHNPFVYFHSIIDDQAKCDAHVVNLNALKADLSAIASTPNFSFITPNLCEDGHDHPCVDGRPGGLISSDQFLRDWVPIILNSPAYRSDGLIVVTFDEAGGGEAEDSAACCNEVAMPGARLPPGRNGPGGGRIGAVLVSPFIAGGTASAQPYNHFSLLRTAEDIFNLPHLGLAGAPGLRAFGRDVFLQRTSSQQH